MDMTMQYPILAYSGSSPSNNEIVFANVNIDQPRKTINIGQWEFVKFIRQD